MGKEKLNMFNVIKFAGAYIAFIIGSGFATGQEILQFYSSYGLWSIGSIAISMFLFAWVGGSVMGLGYDHKEESDIKPYNLFCGKYLGTFYQYFVPLFLFSVVVIMISGAGATLNEYYGLNYYVGCLLMAALVFLACIMGLDKLVNVVGFIGPAIIIFSIFIALATIFPNRNGLAQVDTYIDTISGLQAAPNWIFSGILYAAYNIFGAVMFLSTLGSSAQSKKEATTGGIVGGICLMIATCCMNLALLSQLDEINGLSIPTLYLAKQISPALGIFFSVLLLCGIFSTAAPMLWTVCSRIMTPETGKYKIVALALVVIAFFLGMLPFGVLVGTVYPYTGYLGMLLFVCLAYTQLTKKKQMSQINLTKSNIIRRTTK